MPKCPAGERPSWSAACRDRRSSGGPASCGPDPCQRQQKRWRQRWDPFGMCSWPNEDDRIESFHRHVRDQAKAISGRTWPGSRSSRPASGTASTSAKPCGTGTRAISTSRCCRPAAVHRGRRLPVRGPGRPQVYTHRATWYRRALRGIDPGVLRHRSDAEPGGPGDRPGGVRRSTLPLPAPADPRNLDRSPAPVRRHPGGKVAGCGLPAQQGPPRRGRQPGLPRASWRRLASKYGRKIVHLPLKRFSGQLARAAAHVPRAQRQARAFLRRRLHSRPREPSAAGPRQAIPRDRPTPMLSCSFHSCCHRVRGSC